MVDIDGHLFSDSIFENQFLCDLSVCKGGCCVDGDVGAPLTDEEVNLVIDNYPAIKHLLPMQSIAEVERVGCFEVDDEFDIVTPTIDGGICAYGYYDKQGIVKCGFEAMYLEGKIGFKKPISCHLFPIRISKVGESDIANYEPREGLCDAACSLGKKEQLPVFRFLKEPIIRYYGEEVYASMEEVYKNYFTKMKKLVFVVALIASLATANAQVVDTSGSYKIMTWNTRWMGNPTNCSCDTAWSMNQIIQILQTESPDIVALQEVTDLSYWKRLLSKLSNNYLGVISPYCSLAPDTTSGNYPIQQKLAYLYKPSKVTLLRTWGLAKSTYPFLSNSNSPYYYFSSGRFPFSGEFELKAGSYKDTVILYNLHGKSGSDNTSYNRRLSSAPVFADSINTQYANKKNIVLGDYNDLLKGSILGSTITTPYGYFFTHGFTGLTMPDSFPGEETYYPIANSLIDNIMVNNSALARIPRSSVDILQSVLTYVNGYSNVSDHYPVVFQYQVKKQKDSLTAVANIEKIKVDIYPNPTEGTICISYPSYNPTDVLSVYTMDGKLIWTSVLHTTEIELPSIISSGIYTIKITGADKVLHSLFVLNR